MSAQMTKINHFIIPDRGPHTGVGLVANRQPLSGFLIMEQQCFRLVRKYRGVGSNSNELRDFYPTGNVYMTITTARNCHPDPRGTEYIVSAFRPDGKMTGQDKVDLQNARLKWNRGMQRKVPGFQKRKYKYVTLMRVEG